MLSSRQEVRPWIYSREQNRQDPCSRGVSGLVGGSETKKHIITMCVGFTLGHQVAMRVGTTLRFGVRNGHLDEMQFGLDLRDESTITRQKKQPIETCGRNSPRSPTKSLVFFHFTNLFLLDFSFPNDVTLWGDLYYNIKLLNLCITHAKTSLPADERGK